MSATTTRNVNKPQQLEEKVQFLQLYQTSPTTSTREEWSWETNCEVLWRMDDQLNRMKFLSNAVLDRRFTEEAIWDENDSLLEETELLYGFIPDEETYKDIVFPPEFLDYWNSTRLQDINKWWIRDFLPHRSHLINSLGALERGDVQRIRAIMDKIGWKYEDDDSDDEAEAEPEQEEGDIASDDLSQDHVIGEIGLTTKVGAMAQEILKEK